MDSLYLARAVYQLLDRLCEACNYDASALVVYRDLTVFTTQPPTRPDPRPNRGATPITSPLAKTTNTTLESDHVAVVPVVTMNISSPRVPPMNPARSPAALGSNERIAARTPAMNAPIIIIPPPTVASEFGSRFRIGMTGSEANAPISANRHAGGRVWMRGSDTILTSKSF